MLVVSRPSPTPSAAPAKSTLGSLEIGRFIAASMVVLSHFLPDISAHSATGHPIFGGFATPGPIAVEYFFVLSGFVMMLAHGRDRGNWRAVPGFWWRRAIRIYPMYWLALLIPLWFLYGSLTPGRFAEMFWLQPIGRPEFVPPAWSLRYEISFYLMFGLWLLPYIGRPLLALWIVGVLWRCWWTAPFGLPHLPVPPFPDALSRQFIGEFCDSFAFYFFAGMLSGWVVIRFRLGVAVSLALLAAGLAGLVFELSIDFWGYNYGRPFTRLAIGLAFAAIIAGLAGLEMLRLLKFGRWASKLGKISYPLYILHAPLGLLLDLQISGRKFGIPALYGLALLGLAAVYGISIAATFWIDQPLQRRLRNSRRVALNKPIE